jgi:hypothetical protein
MSENKRQGEYLGLRDRKFTRRWRQLHNEGLHNLHLSPNIISHHINADEMGWAYSMNGEERHMTIGLNYGPLNAARKIRSY